MDHKYTYREKLKPEEKKAKLRDIEIRFGLSDEAIFNMVSRRDFNSVANSLGMGEHPSRGFIRYLKVGQTVANKLPELIRLFQAGSPNSGNSEFFRHYEETIRTELGAQKYLDYLAGDWDEEVLRAVSIAQRRELVPKRHKSKAEEVPRVRFEPKPDYQGYLNR